MQENLDLLKSNKYSRVGSVRDYYVRLNERLSEYKHGFSLKALPHYIGGGASNDRIGETYTGLFNGKFDPVPGVLHLVYHIEDDDLKELKPEVYMVNCSNSVLADLAGRIVGSDLPFNLARQESGLVTFVFNPNKPIKPKVAADHDFAKSAFNLMRAALK